MTMSPRSASYRPFTPHVNALTPFTGVVTLDMARIDQRYMTLDLSAGVTFASKYISAGRTVVVKVTAGAADRTLAFPPWYFVTIRPTSILAGETGFLKVKWFDSTDLGAVAEWLAPSTIAAPGDGGPGDLVVAGLVADWYNTVSGSPVATWFDETATGANLTQTTETNRPTYSSGSGVSFDGANDWMTSGHVIPNALQGYTLFYRVTMATPVEFDILHRITGKLACSGYLSNGFGLEHHSGGSTSVNTYALPTFGTPVTLTFRSDGTHVGTIVRYDGVQQTKATTPFTGDPGVGEVGNFNFVVGAEPSSSNAAQHIHRRIRVYNKALTNAECATVEAIMAAS